MKAVILAGGGGTRLWPLSRRNYPKQFLRLNSDRSLLQQTIERLLGMVSPKDLLIVTNRDYKFYVQSDLINLSVQLDDNLLLEPLAKNTAPAIAFAIKHCIERLSCNRDEVFLVCPSDHLIEPAEDFIGYVKDAEEIARQGLLVTFGLKPTRPETGYGYIKASSDTVILNGKAFPKVDSFTEKPDLNRAKSYLSSGNYYWNSGMFAFRLDVMIEELSQHAPDIAGLFHTPYDKIKELFSLLPSISIDYAVMEKSSKVALVPMNINWNDIGSWDAVYEVLQKDGSGNVLRGDITAIDTRNCLIIGEHHHISTIGIEDCLIIDTPDAILITKRGASQRVKEIVDTLKDSNRSESEEHLTCYRPWGCFTVLEEGLRYKIKRIAVQPGERLSLQMHHHRSEHWVVVKGTAKVTIGDKTLFVHENESVYVPKSTAHKLENPGKIVLEIIEVQNGEYVGEDDIVRLEDKYQRDSL